jgi:hypothetical protein
MNIDLKQLRATLANFVSAFVSADDPNYDQVSSDMWEIKEQYVQLLALQSNKPREELSE